MGGIEGVRGHLEDPGLRYEPYCHAKPFGCNPVLTHGLACLEKPPFHRHHRGGGSARVSGPQVHRACTLYLFLQREPAHKIFPHAGARSDARAGLGVSTGEHAVFAVSGRAAPA